MRMRVFMIKDGDKTPYIVTYNVNNLCVFDNTKGYGTCDYSKPLYQANARRIFIDYYNYRTQNPDYGNTVIAFIKQEESLYYYTLIGTFIIEFSLIEPIKYFSSLICRGRIYPIIVTNNYVILVNECKVLNCDLFSGLSKKKLLGYMPYMKFYEMRDRGLNIGDNFEREIIHLPRYSFPTSSENFKLKIPQVIRFS